MNAQVSPLLQIAALLIAWNLSGADDATPRPASINEVPAPRRTASPLNPSATDRTTVPKPGLVLENADPQARYLLYQHLRGVSVLRHPLVSDSKLSVSTVLPDGVTSRAESAAALEEVFSEAGIALIQDGEKFVLLVPKAIASKIKPGAHQCLTENRWHLDTEVANGLLDFRQADPRTVLGFFADLVHRKPPVVKQGPTGVISIRSQTPLSRLEAAYALEVLLGWNGISLSPVGTDEIGVQLTPPERP